MNVKPGDMAIIIRANHLENIGKVVEVEMLAFPNDAPTEEVWWWVYMDRPGPVGMMNRLSKKGLVRDVDMRPISRIPETIDETKKEIA